MMNLSVWKYSKMAKELNLLATASMAIFSLYVTFVAIFEQNFLAPIRSAHVQPNSTSKREQVATDMENGDDGGLGTQQQYSFSANFFSIFLLWALALGTGRLFHHIRLPPLLGMLLVGISFANIPSLNGLLVLNSNWNNLLRSMAFLLILLRCGIGLNPNVLHKSLLFCSSFGILPTCAEILAIFFVAHFLFNVSISAAILFGFVLASTSPAVTVPTMIHLQQCHRGTRKGIPTIALASASIDNIFCISGFAIAFSIASSSEDGLTRNLLWIPVQLTIAIFMGFFFGFLLRFLPHPTLTKSIHFPRVLLLCSISMGLYFGTKAVHLDVCGPIAVILACFLAASGWKKDNPKGTHLEAEILRQIWNLLLLPLLFVLIGIAFNFSIFTWLILSRAILVLSIGLFVRVLIAFVVAKIGPSFLELKETIFLSIVFLPKATVQAALAPQLFAYSHSAGDEAGADFSLQTCILSILLTAPIGQLVIQQFGLHFLSKDDHKISEGKIGGRKGKIVPDVGILVGLPKMREAEKREEEETVKMEEDIFAQSNNESQKEEEEKKDILQTSLAGKINKESNV